MTPTPLLAHSLAGTAIHSAYYASSVSAAFQPGRSARRARFFVTTVVSAGSSLTTITLKLKTRYNDGTTTTQYVDLPTYLDDAQGAAQPKGPTRETEHAFTVSQPGTFDNTFYIDDCAGLMDVVVDVHANAAGQAGDSVTVRAVLS